MRVSLIEYAVFHSPGGLEDWRLFRIEYGGHAEACIAEGHIWLPPGVDSDQIEKILQEQPE